MSEKSNLFKWNDSLACGIKVIDDQHKGLVDLINDMFSHVTGDAGGENAYFGRVIQGAVDYVKTHFATEERIMRLAEFKKFDEHKSEHDKFVLTVTKNVLDFKTNKDFNLSSFSAFLKDWVLTHIAVMDKEYFKYLRKMATRKANGKLSVTRDDLKRAERSEDSFSVELSG